MWFCGLGAAWTWSEHWKGKLNTMILESEEHNYKAENQQWLTHH